MIRFVLAIVAFIAALVTLGTGSPGNLSYVKWAANETWQAAGFEIVGYEGYQWGGWGYNDYGGARVWYIVRKPDSGIRYNGYLQRWGNEIHIYNLRAIDAIGPSK